MSLVYAPMASDNISKLIRDAFVLQIGDIPIQFEPYLKLVQTMWPELNDRKAQINLAFDIYCEIAQMEGFQIEPELLVKQPRA